MKLAGILIPCLMLTIACNQSTSKAKVFMEEWKQNGPKAAASIISQTDARQWFLSTSYCETGLLGSERVLVDYDFKHSKLVTVRGFYRNTGENYVHDEVRNIKIKYKARNSLLGSEWSYDTEYLNVVIDPNNGSVLYIIQGISMRYLNPSRHTS